MSQSDSYSIALIRRVCEVASPPRLVERLRRDLQQCGVTAAVDRHDTAFIFDWLMTILSYQGISDEVAANYIEDHGNLTWNRITDDLQRSPGCRKLDGHWLFRDCRYQKGTGTCAEPDLISDCPLPRYNLRNGRLNQTAYSLYLFIRDAMAGDVVKWIDIQIETPS